MKALAPELRLAERRLFNSALRGRMKSNTVLITGAAGFIGSGLADRLIADSGDGNTRVILLYHQSNPLQQPQDRNVIAVRGSMNDYTFMSALISRYEINTIYHFASNSIVRKCANDPMNAYVTNVMGTVTLLEAVRNAGINTIERIVIFTSDKVYGHAVPPYNEDTAFVPKYTYESTKACQDIVAQNYLHNYMLPINIVRSSNVFGPGDPNLTRIIPNAIRSIRRGEKPIIFTGVKDYIREFVYIDDVVDGLFLINRTASKGEVYCIGGTETISIEGLVNKICQLMDYRGGVAIVDKPGNFQEIREQSIDSSKLRAMGWSPKFSLEEGLQACIDSVGYGAPGIVGTMLPKRNAALTPAA